MLTQVQHDNVALVLLFLRALEAQQAGAQLADYFSPDLVQEELPNRLVVRGAKRDLGAVLAASERGQHVISSQTYDVWNTVASGDTVAVEMRWTARLAVEALGLPPGGELRGHFSAFFQIRDGRICAIRNYDCYEPW